MTHARHDRSLDDVREHWNRESCGTGSWNADLNTVGKHTEEYFDIIRRHRYAGHGYLHELDVFENARGRRVLEIGCGAGTDAAELASHGADYHGVDLTPEAVENTRRLFALRGLAGTIDVGNAESLKFEDGYFDFVYSFGVIHHTPDIERAVAEIHRVLRPGGRCFVMVYNKWSLNFLYSIVYRRGIRERRLFRGSLQDLIDGSTDKADCPLSRVFSRRQGRRLFRRFANVRTRVRYFRDFHFPVAGRISLEKSRLLGRTLGWHLVIEATK